MLRERSKTYEGIRWRLDNSGTFPFDCGREDITKVSACAALSFFSICQWGLVFSQNRALELEKFQAGRVLAVAGDGNIKTKFFGLKIIITHDNHAKS